MRMAGRLLLILLLAYTRHVGAENTTESGEDAETDLDPHVEGQSAQQEADQEEAHRVEQDDGQDRGEEGGHVVEQQANEEQLEEDMVAGQDEELLWPALHGQAGGRQPQQRAGLQQETAEQVAEERSTEAQMESDGVEEVELQVNQRLEQQAGPEVEQEAGRRDGGLRLEQLEAAGQQEAHTYCTISDILAEQQCPVSSLAADVAAMVSHVSALSRMVLDLTDTNAQLRSNVSRLESDVLDLTARNTELRGGIMVQMDQIDVLQDIIDEQQNNVSNLSQNANCVDYSERVQYFIGDCEDIYNMGFRADGAYRTMLTSCHRLPTTVLCEGMSSTGGRPWTVIQQRVAGDVNFYWPHIEYTRGFGTVSNTTDFWLGLDFMHALTSCSAYMLRIDLSDWEGEWRYAEYGHFRVGSEAEGYRLDLAEFHGTAGNSLMGHSGVRFTAFDDDRDSFLGTNCATEVQAGWWFSECSQSNLNGEYFRPPNHLGQQARGIRWEIWRHNYSLKTASMKVRRALSNK